MPVASGRLRAASLASPPACAMASKPMKLEKSTVDALRKVAQLNGASATGTVRPGSRAARPAAKSAWLYSVPATITTAPRTNMMTMRGISVFSTAPTPRRFTPTNVQRNTSATTRRIGPWSSAAPSAGKPAGMATSRRKGGITYDTTPMATQSPNHCEKLATKPRYGLSPRLA